MVVRTMWAMNNLEPQGGNLGVLPFFSCRLLGTCLFNVGDYCEGVTPSTVAEPEHDPTLSPDWYNGRVH